MSQSAEGILGAVDELHDNSVSFSATYKVTGASGTGSFLLTECQGFKQYMNHFANISIVGDSLTSFVKGPVDATIATTLDICVIPSSHTTQPANAAQIGTVQGNCSCQHSLLVGSQSAVLRFANGVTTQLKPEGVVGSLPRVCYNLKVNGGDAKSEAVIVVQGTLRASGIGFVQTW